MPAPSEAHGLGAHVVGKRVVVRRVLRGETGPSGGPAMTDVLGTCLSWADGACVVQPEDGDPVTIAWADIVSGKPVPPRPSPRLRISPRDAQVRAFALFPDLETEPLGDWTLRRSATATARRANSVLAFGPSGVEDDYDRVVAFYDRPVAAVLPDSAEEAMFVERGWVPESHDAPTLFQLASVARVVRACRFAAIAAKRHVSDAPSCHLAAIAANSQSAAQVVQATIGDHASGIAAYADDWVGFRAIEVAPDQRRQGLGLAVMQALVEWGAEQGATTAYLQVLGDNPAALALYERLGFTTHHAYCYLTPG